MATPYCNRCKQYRKASECAECAQESLLRLRKKGESLVEPTNPANDCAGSHHCLKEWMADKKEPAQAACHHCSQPHLCEGRSAMLFPKCVTNQRKQAEGVERAREALAEAPAARDPAIPRNAPVVIRRVGNGFVVEGYTFGQRVTVRTDDEVLVFQDLGHSNGTEEASLLSFLEHHFTRPEDQR
jgi:hypothetical protein